MKEGKFGPFHSPGHPSTEVALHNHISTVGRLPAEYHFNTCDSRLRDHDDEPERDIALRSNNTTTVCIIALLICRTDLCEHDSTMDPTCSRLDR